MEIRSIQRSGRMHYVYLPTTWCRKHKVSSNTKITVEEDNEGNLTIHPLIKQAKNNHLSINIDENNLDHLQKVIMACFLNPTTSFKIHLKNKVDFHELLKKRELSSMGVIELDHDTIHSESSIHSENPFSLLTTLVRKIKNLLTIMQGEDDRELIERFEEDVDKTKALIEKAVITSLIQPLTRKDTMRSIDLHYISLLSKTLESIVDNLLGVDSKEKPFFTKLLEIIVYLLKSLESYGSNPDTLQPTTAVDFMKLAESFIKDARKDSQFTKRRIGELVDNISELLIDWAITEELLKKR